MKLKVIIQIVTWNSEKFLKDCLDSIFQQTFKSFSVLIIDNGSTDKGMEMVRNDYSKEKIKEKFKRKTSIFIFQNNKNLGFSQAHNQGFNLCRSEYVLVLNPDVILQPDFLAKLVRIANKEKKFGSFGGKLLRIMTGDAECGEKIKTDIIDSTGLNMLKNRHFVDRGQGEKDKGQYDRLTDVFGISGACVLYRRRALEDVKINDEYFDQDFFAYQEDIDLAWRLQSGGWPALYAPQTRAYHYRGAGLKEKANLFEIAQAHFQRSKMIEFFSYRNHLWLLLKNLCWSDFFHYFLWILLYQFGKKIYLFFTKPKILFKAGFSFFSKFGKMLKKRKIIREKAKIRPKELRKWIKKSRFYQ